ncbi:MAG: transposase, partial [Candidatus Poribacteria bacterium]|nr:transposase [Candidatus Poribacteria bacterium]
IAKYFHRRPTGGLGEGLTTKMKLIKRRAFGFRNFENFRIRVMAVFL